MLKLKDVTDLKIDGMDRKDYPDFCDAFFVSGVYIKENRDLTESELDQLTNDYPEVLNDLAFNQYI